MRQARAGVVLILAMGMTAMLAALCLAFIARTRMDAAEMAQLGSITQARLMLSAACAYVLETGRIGWDLSDDFAAASPWSTTYAAAISAGTVQADPDNSRYHEETWGWVDVRDGSVGPRTLDYDQDGTYDPRFDDTPRHARRRGGPLVRPSWPAIGSVCRAPMNVLVRPPFAIRPETAPNPVNADPSAWDFGLPLLRIPDGTASLAPDLPASATQAQRWSDWKAGDRGVRAGGAQGAWFRVHRDSPATFIITVGCGGTAGFRDWDEVEAENMDARYGYSRSLFEQLLAEEIRLWYRIEWSPAVAGRGVPGGSYGNHTRRATTSRPGPAAIINQAGTLSYIQRLPMQPREW